MAATSGNDPQEIQEMNETLNEKTNNDEENAYNKAKNVAQAQNVHYHWALTLNPFTGEKGLSQRWGLSTVKTAGIQVRECDLNGENSSTFAEQKCEEAARRNYEVLMDEEETEKARTLNAMRNAEWMKTKLQNKIQEMKLKKRVRETKALARELEDMKKESGTKEDGPTDAEIEHFNMIGENEMWTWVEASVTKYKENPDGKKINSDTTEATTASESSDAQNAN